MKIGLIGCGAMGSAIIRGACANGLISGADLVVNDCYEPAAQKLKEDLGAHFEPSNPKLVGDTDMVIVAVKPQHQAELLHEVSAAAQAKRTIIVSIAAGRNLADMEECLGGQVPVVRVMPNVNATVGASMSALCGGKYASDEDLAKAQQIFEAVGETTIIKEELFSVYSALAGCSPAWIFRFIDALAQTAVSHGMPKAQGTKAAAQAVVGSGLMVLKALEDGKVPAQLVDQVCSPAGTTVAGLLAMEDKGFSPSVRSAVDAAVWRDQELGKLTK